MSFLCVLRAFVVIFFSHKGLQVFSLMLAEAPIVNLLFKCTGWLLRLLCFGSFKLPFQGASGVVGPMSTQGVATGLN